MVSTGGIWRQREYLSLLLVLLKPMPTYGKCWNQRPFSAKTDTQETAKLDKAISLDQEGASMCSLQLRKHASTKWLAVAPP
jgi:hypothetical protein